MNWLYTTSQLNQFVNFMLAFLCLGRTVKNADCISLDRNKSHQRAELAYWMDEGFWRKGFVPRLLELRSGMLLKIFN
jgi:RimJ/RimL family protein N-acetyltransferase